MLAFNFLTLHQLLSQITVTFKIDYISMSRTIYELKLTYFIYSYHYIVQEEEGELEFIAMFQVWDQL